MIVQLMGGLGNQLFQWAFGVGLAHDLRRRVAFARGRDLGRSGYALDRYPLGVELAEFGAATYREWGLPFNPEAYTAPDGSYLGYFQCEKYFVRAQATVREKLTRPLRLSDMTLAIGRAIDSTPNSVLVHVRRGDNLSPRALVFHGNLADTDYYDRAIEHVRSRVPNPTFFVFSDDPEWCGDNFRPDPCVVVAHNDPVSACQEDLWLMSRCRHAIIANSSFSWWGAWLGPLCERVVVAPERWFVSKDADARDIVPERWCRI